MAEKEFASMNGYPKVCFGCSRCHILDAEHERLSEDETKAFHVDCFKAPVVPIEKIADGSIVDSNPVPEALKPAKPGLDEMIANGFLPDNMAELYQRHLDKLQQANEPVELEVNE